MKLLLRHILLLITLFTASAVRAEDDLYFLVVETVEGSVYTFDFATRPAISFPLGKDLKIDDGLDSTPVIYLTASSVSDIHITTQSGMHTADMPRANISFKGNRIEIRNATPGFKYSIVDISGLQLLSAEADSRGEVLLDISTLAPGLYILAGPDASFKFGI